MKIPAAVNAMIVEGRTPLVPLRTLSSCPYSWGTEKNRTERNRTDEKERKQGECRGRKEAGEEVEEKERRQENKGGEENVGNRCR